MIGYETHRPLRIHRTIYASLGGATGACLAVASVAFQDLGWAYLAFAAVLLASLGLVVGRRLDRHAALALLHPVTNLPDRRYADWRVSQEVARARRDGSALTLLLVNIDDFAEIERRGGGRRVQTALETVAAALRRACGSADFAAHWEEDRYVVICSGASLTESQLLADRIKLLTLACNSSAEAPLLGLTVSIGIAQLNRGESLPPHALFEAADRDLASARLRRRKPIRPRPWSRPPTDVVQVRVN